MPAASLVDVERLGPWCEERLPGSGRVHLRRLAAGHSNLTYVVTRDDRAWILRRPPAGPLLPTAHDVLREYRVLELLARSDVPVRVPRVTIACSDESVAGAPFYLMERAEGVVIRDVLPAWLDEAGRRALGLDLAATLADLHRVDPRPFVAAGLGRPSGYLARQLRRWTGQREGIRAAVAAGGRRARGLPDYDVVRDWLQAGLPAEQAAAVVHGDYKLDNVVVGPGETPRVAAVLDWEMATVGDPRADLGYLLAFWPQDGRAGGGFPLGELATSGPGFPSRAEVVAAWEGGTGRRAGSTTWFETLAVWKLAVLLEASYHRHLAGLTDDPFFATLDEGVPALLAHAREVCGA
ncbi:MAG TPA: phosphotransferase family protein [Actinomycetes bacterium]